MVPSELLWTSGCDREQPFLWKILQSELPSALPGADRDTPESASGQKHQQSGPESEERYPDRKGLALTPAACGEIQGGPDQYDRAKSQRSLEPQSKPIDQQEIYFWSLQFESQSKGSDLKEFGCYFYRWIFSADFKRLNHPVEVSCWKKPGR
jgi:hypothetical protein